MRNPNGYGTVKKLSGNRRRPFAAYVTQGRGEFAKALPDITPLKDVLAPELYEQVEAACQEYEKNAPATLARQVQKPIGYFATRQEAMIALAEYNKNPFSIDGRETTFAQVYECLKPEIDEMKHSAKKMYKTAYDKCKTLQPMKMKDIRLTHLQAIIDEHAHMSKSTQNNIIVLMHSIYKYSIEHDIVDRDYSSYVKITSKAEKKQKSPYSKEEVQKIWDNLDWTVPALNPKALLAGERMVDSVIVMLYTGVRIGELLEIKVGDVHLNERWIDIRGTKTKAAKRAVPIHEKLIPIIKDRLDSCKGEYLFADRKGNKLSYANYIQGFFNAFNTSLKMSHTPHECRHTFVTVSAASGMNQILLKKMVGHSSSDITENVYTHAYIEDLVREIDKFNL